MRNQILRIADLIEKLHLSRSTIYKLIEQDKTFPKPIKLSKRAVGFNSHDIDDWIENKANGSNGLEVKNG